VGVFARNVEDTARLSKVIFGDCSFDATCQNVAVPDLPAEVSQARANGSLKGLKVGLPKEYFLPGINPEVLDAVKGAVKKFESLGAEIVEISLPHTEVALACYYIIAPAEASSNLARYDGVRFGYRNKDAHDLFEMYCRSRSEGFGWEVKRRILIGTFVLSSGSIEAYYRRAQKVRTLIAQDFKEAFKDKCDLILSPTSPFTAFKPGEKMNDPVAMYLCDVFTIPVNLAGLPAASIPCGFDSQGLPIGMHLIGRPWEESTILKAAAVYEAATDWHHKRPTIDCGNGTAGAKRG
jgi:aspartyl-tRNA(Asn)/glutamyl-tRNA(Gln) amidotransferase subunit A